MKKHNGKVLVVDDEKELADLVSFYLIMNGYEVVTAFSSEDAIDKVTEDITLIISDICMPRMNGIEMYKEIVGKLGREPKVLFFSGFKDEAQTQMEGINAPDILSKPIDFKALLNYIHLYASPKQVA